MPAQNTFNTSRLAGKVAVITGATSGIGYAIAQAFAAEGCHLIITGRDHTRVGAAAAKLLAANSGSDIIAQRCDVRDSGAVQALFAMVKARFGRLDILINNAGVSQAPTALEATSDDLWCEMIDTNLTGMFLCARAAVPLMPRGATIVNNLSAAAKQVFPNFAAYTAAKTGAYGFTLSIREELMPRGIRVTALMPGATSTDIWQRIMPEAPRERMMTVESVAQAVLYAVLLPPEANLSELLLTPTLGAM